MPNSAESFLPLKAAVHQILLALGEADSHGYGIIRAVEERSRGQVRVTTGAFYRHLGKLMEAGLIEESDRRPEGDDPRRGAYYRLTPLGREVVVAEADRLAELVSRTSKLGLLRGGGSHERSR